ncbi:hypothetical protein HDU91_006293 [Kappamyces sp. JEL0680]|nr:hypothetical protein HDU91_006293 [Kappamyces sp. JEL0680]
MNPGDASDDAKNAAGTSKREREQDTSSADSKKVKLQKIAISSKEDTVASGPRSSTLPAPKKAATDRRRPSSVQGSTSKPVSRSNDGAGTKESEAKSLLETEDGIILPGRKKALPRAQVNARDRAGRSVLFKFVGAGDYATTEALLKFGASPHIQDYAGVTPLHEACLKGRSSIVDLLLAHEVDADAPGDGGDRPLHDAVGNLHLDVVLQLLKHGASLDIANDMGQTPEDCAVQDLERYDEDIDAQSIELSRRIIDVLREWREMTVKAVQRNNEGQTLLHLACSDGNAQQTLSLLEYGADINAADNGGWYPIHNACLNGYHAIVQILLRYGSEVDPVGKHGETPLHDAAANGHSECAALLLKYGAEPFRCNEDGKTPRDLIPPNDETMAELFSKPPEHWLPTALPEFYPRLIQSSKEEKPAEPVEKRPESAGSSIRTKGSRREVIVAQPGSFAWGGLEGKGAFESAREEKKIQALLKKLAGDKPADTGDNESRAKPSQIPKPHRLRQDSIDSVRSAEKPSEPHSPKVEVKKKRAVEASSVVPEKKAKVYGTAVLTRRESRDAGSKDKEAKKAGSNRKEPMDTRAAAPQEPDPKKPERPPSKQLPSDCLVPKPMQLARPNAKPPVRPEKPPAPISKLHLAVAEAQASDATQGSNKKKKRFQIAGYQAAGESSTEVSSETIFADPLANDGAAQAQIPPATVPESAASAIDRKPSPSPHVAVPAGVNTFFQLTAGSESAAKTPTSDPVKKIDRVETSQKKTEAERRLCLPLCAYIKPHSDPYFRPINISRENLWGSLPKHDHTKVFLDFQLAYCLGFQTGRQLLDKYPYLKSRVATTLEKTALESGPLSRRLLHTMALHMDITWVPKQAVDGVECLKLSEVDMHIIFWNEDLFHLLNSQMNAEEKKLQCQLDWIQDLVWPISDEEKKEPIVPAVPKSYVHKLKRMHSHQ